MTPEVLRAHEQPLGNPELPIAKHRAEIQSALINQKVTIVSASTGSGKTTQIPQYACELNIFDAISITQPRILATRTVTERVAYEMAEADASYKLGFYTGKVSSIEPQHTRDLAFMTDGKAAIQLLHSMNKPPTGKKTLLGIDEFHERNPYIDLLTAIAREKTDPTSKFHDPGFSVMFMSATMDTSQLEEYMQHAWPTVIEINARTYPVVESVSSRSVASMALSKARENQGKVLAFLPGKREIARVADVVDDRQGNIIDGIPVVPLHGQQTAKQQDRAFSSYPQGAIVAATPAAETSITVPETIAVIDSGEIREDEIRYDLLSTGSQGLYLKDASKANLKQRGGRVGRTEAGEYILCSPDGKNPPLPIEDRPEYAVPAIQRTRLDSMLLGLKATGHEFSDFDFMQKPPSQAIHAARKRLFNLGAISEDGIITERGMRMEQLPLDPEYACMIVFAQERGYSKEVLRNVIDIAAIMQLGGILKRGPNDQNWRDLLKRDIYDEISEVDSDFFAQLEAYIELTSHVHTSDWSRYDVIEHSVGSVEQARQTLTDRLGVHLHEPALVTEEDRQAVLTCIHAGQLNQLWRRKGDSWVSVLEKSPEFELSQSSVVASLGEFATGSLFTLGLKGKDIHSIVDVNAVVQMESLELAAKHLVVDEIDDMPPVYSAEHQSLMVAVHRKLGGITLRTFTQPFEAEADSPETVLLREGHKKHAWNNWPERTEKQPAQSLDDINAALEGLEFAQYGTDIVTGEPLLAWRGGNNGQWCQSKTDAVKSLEAARKKILGAPLKAQQKELKKEIEFTLKALRAHKKNGQDVEQIKKLISKKKKMSKDEWLKAANKLLKPVPA